MKISFRHDSSVPTL